MDPFCGNLIGPRSSMLFLHLPVSLTNKLQIYKWRIAPASNVLVIVVGGALLTLWGRYNSKGVEFLWIRSQICAKENTSG